jgi:branched-subunit amino acid transport protein
MTFCHYEPLITLPLIMKRVLTFASVAVLEATDIKSS